MTWVSDNLEPFKAWLGGTPDDAAATRALTLALQTVETWLDRELELAERVQENGPACVILLRAWPVLSIASITYGTALTPLAPENWRLDARTGVLTPAGYFWSTTVTYTGGLDPFPIDLQMALWAVAAELYPGMLSATGAGTGQAVRRVTTPDVGTVEYASSSGGAGRQSDALLGATLSPAIEAALSRYRAESVLGVG